MEQRIFHGAINPPDIAQALLSHFNRGNYIVQQIGEADQLSVQIATRQNASAGGQTALTVNLQKVEDGVSVSVGRQEWLGVAASIGVTALAALKNPFNLLWRLDDLAQDVESLQMVEEVWGVIGEITRSLGMGHELSDRLKRIACTYCNSSNPVGEPRCIACGAPLGDAQPQTCNRCGFVIKKAENFCPNCGAPLTTSQNRSQ